MFQFKLSNDQIVDATKKNVSISRLGANGTVNVITEGITHATTQTVKFDINDLKSIITDNGEIEIQNGDDPYDKIRQIKNVFFEYNTEDQVMPPVEPEPNPDPSPTDPVPNPDVPENPEDPSPNEPDEPELPKTINLVFDWDDGEHIVTQTIEQGTAATAVEIPTKTGYTFDHWEPEFNESNVYDTDMTFIAKYSPAETAYTVRHMKENLVSGTFTLDSEETLTGLTGSMTEAIAKEYEGFKAQDIIEQATILPDGSTIIEIEYFRKDITITFDFDGGEMLDGSTSSATIVKYGAPGLLEDDLPVVIKENCAFNGWIPDITNTEITSDITVKADWITNETEGDEQGNSHMSSDTQNGGDPIIVE